MNLMEPTEISWKPVLPADDPTTIWRAQLLPSLGKLVRGLSCIFWGIPCLLVASLQAARAEPTRLLHLWITLATFTLVLFGTHLIAAFQPQERIWQKAIDRVRLLAFLNLGLSPFIFWWSKLPHVAFFQLMVDSIVVVFLLFLFQLNLALDRLVAMLPEETLRHEARFYTRLCCWLIAPVLIMMVFYFVMIRIPKAGPALVAWLEIYAGSGFWMTIMLLLVPVAMTMALLWKVKEVVYHAVFGSEPLSHL